ncbi:EscT/YscT/HrcT family type III secretion system export apparatus protein [Hahella sp. CCB-MM4]|uniref:type III secretion system export apparatus subunit SctT n=1 Tax=Hahella sp. (strain CCB-MM4) TaxID=1926491 RepID=UPI000B9ACC51|nr:type III secretion system export apparatus subunit SctT [Hahella sp. CCB-MM4]OZG74348.1 EscT/YscT/HrcT family type III secretion system export apparatus protein [Hahella sp. CCB-MM4]
MDIEHVSRVMFVFFLSSARMLATFTMMPFLSKQSLGSAMVRNGVVASFSLLTFPLVEYSLGQQSISGWHTLLIIGKEILIGLALGYVVNIPFWAVESVGFFIDNQRGATLASALNPLSGSQTSPLGILLTQSLVTVFFSSGIFLLMLYTLYMSYSLWPIFDFFPGLAASAPAFFLSQLDTLMRLTVLLGAPVVIAMFLSEFGLALISRFAPQLNVFILAMPIKSAVGIALLCLYAGFIIHYFSELLRDMQALVTPVIELLS